MSNIFTKSDVCELGITFMVSGRKFSYDFKYDEKKEEYVYEAFSEIQLTVLEKLLADLEQRYGELVILGHSDIQQASVDPGPAFPRAKFFTGRPD